MFNKDFYSKFSNFLSELSETEVRKFFFDQPSDDPWLYEETLRPEIADEFLQRLQEPIFKQLSEYITKYIISVDFTNFPTTLSINGRGLLFNTQAGFLFVGYAGHWYLQIGFWMSYTHLTYRQDWISSNHDTYRQDWIRFQNNIYQNHPEINSILKVLTEQYPLEFAYSTLDYDRCRSSKLTMEEWSRDIQNKEYHLQDIVVTAEISLLDTSNKDFSFFELSKDIVSILKKLFPLVLLAKYDDPMPLIYEYLSVTGIRYPLSQCSQETNFPETQLTQWIRAINRKKQAIFQGPPGIGKTFLAQKLAQHLIAGGDGFWELIQFHPAYTYEDFIQGIRPQSEDGKLTYPVVPGRFLKFCQKAALCQDTCVLIIDEINRANLSQVFGELMYLLEYRDAKISLASSGELFSIPENVRIIGTMNTADRSIALVDHALRRRFAFINLSPNYEILRQYHKEIETNFSVEGLIQVLEEVNKEINDPNYQVGVSFFLRENIAEEIQDIWQMEIEPYLEEYFFAQPGKVDNFRWDKIQNRMSSAINN
ncbi:MULTISPECIES: AAA family ATPase [unclassified Okeania]|uniref:AAA family ATPase n=1 Tax=unclassified Okeania TaxID=2634635 RepID=UPI00257F67F7|nr:MULTISPECIES: AAA family ATPase [unclassified Okeania]